MKPMSKMWIIGVLLLISLYVLPAAALELTGEPEMIYEGKEGYGLYAMTDGKYILVGEERSNPDYNNRIEGYLFMGTLYLYDIAERTLLEIPGNIPPYINYFTVIDDVVFWQSAPYKRYLENGKEEITSNVYQYTIGDSAPKKLDVSSFSDTDGVRMVITHGTQMHPEDIRIEVYDLRMGEITDVPGSANIRIGSAKISGDLVIWSEDLPKGDGMIYLYNLSSDTRSTIQAGDEKYLSVMDLSDSTITYLEKTYQKSNNIRSVNLTTNEKLVLSSQPMRYSLRTDPPLVAWSLYPDYSVEGSRRSVYVTSLAEAAEPVFLADEGRVESVGNGVVVWSEWNESAEFQQRIFMAKLSGDGVDQLPSTQGQQPRQPTAASSLNIIVGSIAFALACVLAVLWRKK